MASELSRTPSISVEMDPGSQGAIAARLAALRANISVSAGAASAVRAQVPRSVVPTLTSFARVLPTAHAAPFDPSGTAESLRAALHRQTTGHSAVGPSRPSAIPSASPVVGCDAAPHRHVHPLTLTHGGARSRSRWNHWGSSTPPQLVVPALVVPSPVPSSAPLSPRAVPSFGLTRLRACGRRSRQASWTLWSTASALSTKRRCGMSQRSGSPAPRATLATHWCS